jgi:ribonuclease-3
MKLGYTFKNPELLKQALTHSSLYQHRDRKLEIGVSYERLEFLGDSVLGLVVADLLYRNFPNDNEGRLAVMHSNLVNYRTLSSVARQLDLSAEIIMGEAEKLEDIANNTNILADCMEAIIGAVYLDSGFEASYEFVSRLWLEVMKDVDKISQKDSKSALQEWAQKTSGTLPAYRVLQCSGESHNPLFTVEVKAGNLPPVIASGRNKRQAEQQAAQQLMDNIEKSKR